ncbi:tyrosine-type recombinase/integrase [Dyadobacter sp. 32]|uniref:tyrosine-type recombinase/integrase n=1 Tax=Dyadobacter sp. 32 TaxID=538966 RepID=UPI0011EE1A60
MESEIHYLDKRKSDKLLLTVSNIRYKTAFLLMMDCGLRVSETVSLQFSNFDFRKKTITVRSLKKRDDVQHRKIPISDRLYQALSEYVTTLKDTTPDAWLFPHPTREGHLNRKAMNSACNRVRAKDPEFKNLHPHALRHTCATQLLSSGAQLHEIKEILGHKKYDTTLIYSHIPTEILRQRIDTMTKPKLGLWQRIQNYLVAPKRATLINLSHDINNFIIGRNAELLQITELINKNCNVILMGKIGIGKTHLMNQITPDKKILRFDDFTDIKKTLIGALIYLYQNDKQTIYEMVYGDFDLDKLDTQLQRDSVSALCKTLVSTVAKHEYLLIIDNCDRITPKGIKALEELKDHFTILTSAREIPINKSSFLWNFETIRIENLSRQNSLELIHKLAYDIEIEDFEIFRNHIWEQSNGNPRVIFELVERFRKEIIVSTDIVRSVKHHGSMKEIDMSFAVMLLLASMAILRYASAEVGNDSLKFIGGCAMILLLFSRYIFNFTKRKVI